MRHTYNSTQTHIQSTHSVNESCVTVSKGQTHTDTRTFHENPVLRSPCMRTDSHGCLFKPPCGFHFIAQTAQDISSLALPPLPMYNQTVLPFMLTYALLSFIVHDGFI